MKAKYRLRLHLLKRAKKNHLRTIFIKEKNRLRRRLFNGVIKKLRNYNQRIDNYKKTHYFVSAPKIFSLSKNYIEFIKFTNKFENIKDKANGRRIMFDLTNVIEIDFSGISILIALVYKLKLKKISFNGLNPKKQELFLKLEQYNFFQQIGMKPSFDNIHFSLGKKGDKITIKGDTLVKPQLGLDVANYISQKLFNQDGYRNDGIYILLLELMANTTKWSNQTNDNNLWLLTMSYNNVEKSIDFQFIDFGIGIFESLNLSKKYNSWLGQIRSVINSNAKILESMLQGSSKTFKSSTGLYFRGKGIPSIKENFEKNYYNRVEILTNNVYVNLDLNIYENLDKVFNGTLIKWSVNADNNFINFGNKL